MYPLTAATASVMFASKKEKIGTSVQWILGYVQLGILWPHLKEPMTWDSLRHAAVTQWSTNTPFRGCGHWMETQLCKDFAVSCTGVRITKCWLLGYFSTVQSNCLRCFVPPSYPVYDRNTSWCVNLTFRWFKTAVKPSGNNHKGSWEPFWNILKIVNNNKTKF